MEMKDLNKSQLILLALLISFVASIAASIATVTLLQQAPPAVAQTINRIVQKTIETVVPSDISKKPALSADETKLLTQLKTVGSFVATIVVRKEGKSDVVVGSGFFFGDNRVIVAPALPENKENTLYVVQSIFGEQMIDNVTSEKDYSILELKKKEVITAPPETLPATETPVPIITPVSPEIPAPVETPVLPETPKTQASVDQTPAEIPTVN